MDFSRVPQPTDSIFHRAMLPARLVFRAGPGRETLRGGVVSMDLSNVAR